MESLVKKVAAIHDLSGYGRASLTTIIPILSNMKVQVCPVPTAILSTHTGGFEGYSFIDLTDYMQEHIAHWKRLDLEFDCIYSGFLGSPKQIEIVADFIDYFGKKSKFIVVDPVMGDNGKLYSTMDNEMVVGMRNLIKKADIITPNFTEVMYLLGKEYDKNIDIEKVKEYLKELSNMGPKIVIATSVPEIEENKMDKKTSVVAYDRENDVFWRVSCRYIPASYPGTGDAYTSVVIGSLLQGDSLPMAIERGVQFITQCIMASYGFKYPKKEGVLLEKMLDVLKMPMIATNYEMLE
ncbi:pyridoxamine kinase [Fusobacterium mortiferum]|jgi:pyridoxine kinase|uniref:pyridoxal kinase n=1 Tax=Fusobacterium mortiferum ATCC 9817 TaxID=469616 RepID=A0ABM6TZ08_FUSMR|nr:pyridoxamine kinase [Fusobacterium mortiferum]AVQ19700.1 pyridoxamine kinase [Fusobacterium mortiferum ATCC 9817]EEO35876.1 pyridoxal kinase [Fusobacterium mortiferum ATCC 9817]MCF2627044.1 pyridoxamine kinase [Fusobacterium mortiferum]MCF2698382.1 pyridoxamine kinase [Fusobacterium mortiferum]MCI6382876.1 pyridoxamine kinase [Fusobacterium mortiferum]